MFKKISVVILLVGAAIFALPAAANADYIPVELGGAGTAQNLPGGAQTVAFKAGAFTGGSTGGEQVEVTVTGEPTPSLGLLKSSVSRLYTADKDGALNFRIIVPITATADTVYSIAARGVTSGSVGTFVITVVSKDSDVGRALLAATGGPAPALLIWGSAGIAVLGAALLTVRRIDRRNRVNI